MEKNFKGMVELPVILGTLLLLLIIEIKPKGAIMKSATVISKILYFCKTSGESVAAIHDRKTKEVHYYHGFEDNMGLPQMVEVSRSVAAILAA